MLQCSATTQHMRQRIMASLMQPPWGVFPIALDFYGKSLHWKKQICNLNPGVLEIVTGINFGTKELRK
jgi:hypothetical protein